MERERAEIETGAMAPSAEAAAGQLMQVMGELREIFLAENNLLRRGLPAGVVEMVDRKTALSDEFTQLYRDVFVQHADELAANPRLRERLMDSGHELQSLSDENMWRLEAALTATRRRVDAVMLAIRVHEREDESFDDGGMAVGSGVDGVTNMNLRA